MASAGRSLIGRVRPGNRAVSTCGNEQSRSSAGSSVASIRNRSIWQQLFADLDHEETLGPIVWRHPYLDLRVLAFMLSVPPVPWARRKLLLREAMHGRLPDEVLARTKTAFWGSTIAQPIRTHGLPALSRGGRLRAYVDVQALPVGMPAQNDLDRIVAVHALDYWLEQGTP